MVATVLFAAAVPAQAIDILADLDQASSRLAYLKQCPESAVYVARANAAIAGDVTAKSYDLQVGVASMNLGDALDQCARRYMDAATEPRSLLNDANPISVAAAVAYYSATKHFANLVPHGEINEPSRALVVAMAHSAMQEVRFVQRFDTSPADLRIATAVEEQVGIMIQRSDPSTYIR